MLHSVRPDEKERTIVFFRHPEIYLSDGLTRDLAAGALTSPYIRELLYFLPNDFGTTCRNVCFLCGLFCLFTAFFSLGGEFARAGKTERVKNQDLSEFFVFFL